MDASRYRAHDTLGRAYEQKGMHAQALVAFEKAVATSQEGSATLASLAAGYGAAGRRNEALRIVNRLKLKSRHEYVPAYGLAEVYATLGDKEGAFAWLERAHEERSSWLVYIKVQPRLDGLRSDSRFQDLLRRMRLGPPEAVSGYACQKLARAASGRAVSTKGVRRQHEERDGNTGCIRRPERAVSCWFSIGFVKLPPSIST